MAGVKTLNPMPRHPRIHLISPQFLPLFQINGMFQSFHSQSWDPARLPCVVNSECFCVKRRDSGAQGNRVQQRSGLHFLHHPEQEVQAPHLVAVSSARTSSSLGLAGVNYLHGLGSTCASSMPGLWSEGTVPAQPRGHAVRLGGCFAGRQQQPGKPRQQAGSRARMAEKPCSPPPPILLISPRFAQAGNCC